MLFTVEKVITGDQIQLSQNWIWEEKSGNIVIVYGYATPGPQMEGFEFAKMKLQKLVEAREVELFEPRFHPTKFGFDKLVCRVYLDGIDIANFFPEFKNYNSRHLRGFEGF